MPYPKEKPVSPARKQKKLRIKIKITFSPRNVYQLYQTYFLEQLGKLQMKICMFYSYNLSCHLQRTVLTQSGHSKSDKLFLIKQAELNLNFIKCSQNH